MVILAKLSWDQWIGIFTVGVAALVGITGNAISYFHYKKEDRLPTPAVIYRPLDKWKQNSLCVRIFLHRISAIITLILVLVLLRQTAAKFVRYMLWGVMIFEVSWFFKHLRINPSAKHRDKKEG